jgi:enoyl-CoA hydratase/3-hydroxyacyl-CoA dehydrogenase
VSGFIVNNVLSPFIVEPAWMVSDGESTIREDRTPEFQGE